MKQQTLEEKIRIALGELGATWEDPEMVIQNVLQIIQEEKTEFERCECGSWESNAHYTMKENTLPS